jgi:predicted nucleotidyltransferase
MGVFYETINITSLNNTMNQVIGKLKNYFESRDDIAMAFLYGSWAKGQEGIDSDVDIALCFRPRDGIVEWEELDSHYDGESQIWLDLERIVERDVDLLVLNRVAPTVADSALGGIPIVIKDAKLYMDFLLRITSEAIDFREWVEEYWNLKQQVRNETNPRE